MGTLYDVAAFAVGFYINYVEYKYWYKVAEADTSISFTLTMWNINNERVESLKPYDLFYINYVEYKSSSS